MASPGASSFAAALISEDFPWVESEEETGVALDKYREVFDLAQRGALVFRDGRFDMAISFYSKAQTLRSGDPIILSNRSSAFCMISQVLRERSAADSEYQPLNGLDPTTHVELVLKDAEKLEQYHEAREAILAGLQVDPLRNTNIATGARHPRLDKTDDFECTSCFKLLFEPVTTPCGHSFCRLCLHQSMDHGNKCPMCRTVLFIGLKTYPIRNFFLKNMLRGSQNMRL